MSSTSLAFEASQELVDELMARETFAGIVAFKESDPHTGRCEPNSTVRIEIAAGLSDEQAIELLNEVHKSLVQLLAKLSHGR